MIRLDAATVLLQWAAGGWTFLWFSTRRGQIGPGYGWLLRSIHVVLAAGAVAAGIAFGVVPVRETAAALATAVGLAVLVLSIVRRPSTTSASGHPQYVPSDSGGGAAARSGRHRSVPSDSGGAPAARSGHEESVPSDSGGGATAGSGHHRSVPSESGGAPAAGSGHHQSATSDSGGAPAAGSGNHQSVGASARYADRAAEAGRSLGSDRREAATRRQRMPAWLDLVAPAIAVVGLVAAAVDAAGDDAGGGRIAVSLLRTLAGAAFLGAVTDAMLLGHWYLVQPGLPRKHLNDLVRVLGVIWPIEVAALLLPTGMISVWLGTVDDGWNGTLGWFWGASAATTIVLVFVTRAALKERSYSAVMAATGLLYLAILTAFGTDLVARAVLAG